MKLKIKKNLLERSWTKCGGEASPRPFYEKSKLSMSIDQQFVFIVCLSRGLPKYIMTEVLTTCFYLI